MTSISQNSLQTEFARDRSKFYRLEPDCDRPMSDVLIKHKKRILDKLTIIYGEETAKTSFTDLERIMKVHYAYKDPKMIEWEKDFDPTERFTEKDVFLITYGDLIQNGDQLPLELLSDFSEQYLKGAINTLHILPFFPYSSDRGFSIIDFEEVDPRLGTWENIEKLKTNFRLMFDGVFNHASSKSRWFQEFLDGNPDFQIKRFLASRSIALVLMGVPGIYLHSLFGSKNDADAVLEEEQTRSINRRTIDRDNLYRALNDKETSTYKISHHFGEMIEKRTKERAFHPNGPQQILSISDALFSLIRTSVDGKEHILCITNITDEDQDITFDARKAGLQAERWRDVLSGKQFKSPHGVLSLNLTPYDVLWLKTGE